MRTETRITATTHIDLHGDRLTRTALDGMARQIVECYVPITWDHDVRYPPLGRVVSAHVVSLGDVEWGLESTIEYWDDTDSLDSVSSDGRRIPVSSDESSDPFLLYDRTMSTGADLAALDRVAETLGVDVEPRLNVKKAVEPISILVIGAGLYVVGQLVSGFVSRIGSDAYDALKHRLVEFYKGRPVGQGLLDIDFGAVGERGNYDVHVLIVGPDDPTISSLFDAEFAGLDDLVLQVNEQAQDVAKIVVLWRDGHVSLAYAERSDAFPVLVDWDYVDTLPLPAPNGEEDSAKA